MVSSVFDLSKFDNKERLKLPGICGKTDGASSTAKILPIYESSIQNKLSQSESVSKVLVQKTEANKDETKEAEGKALDQKDVNKKTAELHCISSHEDRACIAYCCDADRSCLASSHKKKKKRRKREKNKSEKSENESMLLKRKPVDQRDVNKQASITTKSTTKVENLSKTIHRKEEIDKSPQNSQAVVTNCKPGTKAETTHCEYETDQNQILVDLTPRGIDTFHHLIWLLRADSYYEKTLKNYTKVQPLSCIASLTNLIRSYGDSYARLRRDSKAKAWKLINHLYEYINGLQQIRLSQPVSGPEAFTFNILDSCATLFTETVARDVYEKKGRECPKCIEEPSLDLSSQDYGVEIFKTMLRDFNCSEEFLQVADSCRERRFLYDASYWSPDCDQHCDTWLNFRQVYLNCGKLTAHPIQTLTMLQEFQEPQNLIGVNVESASGDDSAEGDTYRHEDTDVLTIVAEACDNLEDTPASDSHLDLYDYSDLTVEEINAQVGSFKLREAKSLVPNEDFDFETINMITTREWNDQKLCGICIEEDSASIGFGCYCDKSCVASGQKRKKRTRRRRQKHESGTESMVLEQKTEENQDEKEETEQKPVGQGGVNKQIPVTTESNTAATTVNSVKNKNEDGKVQLVVAQNAEETDKNPQALETVTTECRPETTARTTCNEHQPTEVVSNPDYEATYNHLVWLLAHVPLDMESIEWSLADLHRSLQDPEYQLLPYFSSLRNLIESLAEGYTKFGDMKEARIWKVINHFYEHMKSFQHMGWPELDSGILASLDFLATHVSEVFVAHVYTMKGRAYPRCMRQPSRHLDHYHRVEIFKTMLHDFRCPAAFLQVADSFRQRRFLYDGSYWSPDCDPDCDKWPNFREAYLNCSDLTVVAREFDVVAKFPRESKFD